MIVGERQRRWLRQLDRFVMPPLCAFCQTPLVGDELAVCSPCHEDLPWNAPCCPRCALPVGTPETVCARCQARPPSFQRVIAPFRFEFPVSAGLRRLKFRRRFEFAPAIGVAMASTAKRAFAGLDFVPDLLAPVPLYFLRHGMRGYNQADLLARPVAKRLELPVLRDATRVRRTRPQTGLTTGERRRNLIAAFRVGPDVEGRHVLIIDDVMTTGATVTEFRRSLMHAGAASVSVLVAARRALD